MKHVHKLLCLGFLPLAAAVWAAPADDPHIPAPSAVASGVYSVNFHVNGATPVPTGGTLTCKAKIVPTLPGAPSLSPQPVVGVGSAAGCALEIPYAWSLNQAKAVGSLSYEVDAVSSSGAVVERTSRQGVGVAPPPAGGTAKIDLAVTF